MASDEDKQELKRKVKKLVDDKFKGDYQKAFDHYDQSINKNGTINQRELEQLLKDADVGNWGTRGSWAEEIIKDLDEDGDKSISWKEFEKKLKESK